MKKTICIVLSVIFTLSLFGCNGKPSELSEGHYNYGLKFLSVADDYLDLEITIEEADVEIERLQAEMPKADISDIRNRNLDDYVLESTINLLKARISYAKTSSFLGKGVTNYDEILESRNDLAEKLNQPKR